MVNIVYMYVVYTSACMEEKLTIQTKHLNHDKNRHMTKLKEFDERLHEEKTTLTPRPQSSNIQEHTGQSQRTQTHYSLCLLQSLFMPCTHVFT